MLLLSSVLFVCLKKKCLMKLLLLVVVVVVVFYFFFFFLDKVTITAVAIWPRLMCACAAAADQCTIETLFATS